MKRETKELINWIIQIIEQKYPEVTNGETDEEVEENKRLIKEFYAKKENAIKFLSEDLPKIESHLRRGGYIQDVNGTPCCEGDVIEYKHIRINEFLKGTLYWSVNDKRFFVKDNDNLYLIGTDFRKVEK